MNALQPVDGVVFVVDDDGPSRESVCALARSMGVKALSFPTAEEFLQSYTDESPACLVADVRMPGMNGFELQDTLRQRRWRIPVIMITAFARTPLTVRAMRNGAVTMLDKPYHDDELWSAISMALQSDESLRTASRRRQLMRARLNSLTTNEREVLTYVVNGMANKAIAAKCGVSERTVESRRREVFQKMEAESLAELVRIVVELEHESSRLYPS